MPYCLVSFSFFVSMASNGKFQPMAYKHKKTALLGKNPNNAVIAFYAVISGKY